MVSGEIFWRIFLAPAVKKRARARTLRGDRRRKASEGQPVSLFECAPVTVSAAGVIVVIHYIVIVVPVVVVVVVVI